MSLKSQGFTLMEMLVALCIIGVIAGLALPQYTKSVERARRKDAENQLLLIHSAQEQYAAHNSGEYWGPAAGATPEAKLASINQNLGLNILANGKNYDCDVVYDTGKVVAYNCTAAQNDFTITVTEAAVNPGVNPSCTGSCT